jgi:hypothetical protein
MSRLDDILANMVAQDDNAALALLSGVGASPVMKMGGLHAAGNQMTLGSAAKKAQALLGLRQAAQNADMVSRIQEGGAYHRPTLLVGLDSDATLGAGVPILAGATQTLRTQTEDRGKPISFRVRAANAGDFLITAIVVHRTTCLSSTQGVPADAYVIEPLPLDCEIVEAGRNIAVTVTNISGAARRFIAEFRMEDR